MDIQKALSTINLIKEIPILKDPNILADNFSSLNAANSVHYVLYPFLQILGYNVFNPTEVKVVNTNNIQIFEEGNQLAHISLVDISKMQIEPFTFLDTNKTELGFVTDVPLIIHTNGIHFKLFSKEEELLSYDIRDLDSTNVELLFKLLRKESLKDSIANPKFFTECIIESKFGNLVGSSYVLDIVKAQLETPSDAFITLIAQSIQEKYCYRIDTEKLKGQLIQELAQNPTGFLNFFNVDVPKKSITDELDLPNTEEIKEYAPLGNSKKEDDYTTLPDDYTTLDTVTAETAETTETTETTEAEPTVAADTVIEDEVVTEEGTSTKLILDDNDDLNELLDI